MQQVSTGLQFVNKAMAKQLTGLSYLGGINHSAKIAKNAKKGIDTYILYLAPSDSSGYNVCPMATEDCIKACLSESGHNRIDTKKNMINKARVKKTKLFFEEREFFMKWLCSEIDTYKAAAEKKGHGFSVRLNGTSDISPVQFRLNGKNILELYPDVQFYDYTKVLRRTELLYAYPNYDLTFSFSGSNWNDCEQAMVRGARVAVVFENELPAFFKGWPVVSGDESDVRYFDAPDVIVGLKFKKVRNKIDISTQKFIIPHGDEDCVY
jgi:hypothetical protein